MCNEIIVSFSYHLVLHPGRCKTSSVGQSAGLLILRSSVRFLQKLQKSRTRIYIDLSYIVPQAAGGKGTKLLLQVIKAITNQIGRHTWNCQICTHIHTEIHTHAHTKNPKKTRGKKKEEDVTTKKEEEDVTTIRKKEEDVTTISLFTEFEKYLQF